MNWKRWKAGLFVSLLTGLLTGLGAYQIADNINLQSFGFFIAASMAKDALLWLKSQPIPEE